MTRSGKAILESLDDIGLSALKMDGFDAAVTGYVYSSDDDQVQLVYRYNACIAALMSDGMTEDEAMEYFEFNCLGSLMGWSEDTNGYPTPLILYD